MSHKLPVYYAKVDNMGDKLNREIIQKCFGYDVVRRTYLTGKISGIGSGLGNYTYGGEIWKNCLKALSGLFFPTVYIWGTGFVRYRDADPAFYKRKIRFCAVRGELSKARVEKTLGKSLDIPTGDAGILASCLLSSRPAAEYDVGIIAHYKEQQEPAFQKLAKRFPHSLLINVRQEPEPVVRAIAACKTILSSSLHGLIIADSLGIPNRHIVVTDNLLGDGFKFDDYYSAYGLAHEFTDMNTDDVTDLELIRSRYRITNEMVEKKKADMLGCFPYPAVREAEGSQSL